VTNNDEATLEVDQGVDKCVDCIIVQMISRLVEHENMGVLPGDDGEGDARFLTTRKLVHGGKGILAAETEAAEMRAEHVPVNFRMKPLQLLHGGNLQVQTLHMMLVEHSNPQAIVNEAASTLFLELAHQTLQQRRLTGTVGANESDTRLLVDIDINSCKDGLTWDPADFAFIDAHNWRGDLLWSREPELDVRVLENFIDHSVFDFGDCLRSRLGESGKLLVSAEPVNERLHVSHLFL